MRNEFRIADIKLAPEGHRRMEWAWEYMPVLKLIAEKEAASKPLDGVTVGACLHLEAKTACLLKVLRGLGATGLHRDGDRIEFFFNGQLDTLIIALSQMHVRDLRISMDVPVR